MGRRVLVTGGGGYIGGELVDALVAGGFEVRALARSDAAAASIAARGVSEVVRGDVLDETALRAAADGCARVFHVAGVNSHCPKDRRRLWQVNVEGTVAVVRAAAAAGVPRVVLTSSAATLGEPTGTVGDEHTAHRGYYLSLYEQSKLAAERAAFAVAAGGATEVVALCPTSVQGPPRGTGSAAIIIAYLNRRLRAFVDTRLSVVDVRDVTDAHLRAADGGRPGERYVLSTAAVSSAEALELLASGSGIRYHVAIVPPWLARGVCALVEDVARAARVKPPVCRARIDTILHGHRYDGSRAVRELGVSYTPVAETFARTIAWARETGLVSG